MRRFLNLAEIRCRFASEGGVALNVVQDQRNKTDEIELEIAPLDPTKCLGKQFSI